MKKTIRNGLADLNEACAHQGGGAHPVRAAVSELNPVDGVEGRPGRTGVCTAAWGFPPIRPTGPTDTGIVVSRNSATEGGTMAHALASRRGSVMPLPQRFATRRRALSMRSIRSSEPLSIRDGALIDRLVWGRRGSTP